jgi:hypothetical protein
MTLPSDPDALWERRKELITLVARYQAELSDGRTKADLEHREMCLAKIAEIHAELRRIKLALHLT